MVHSSKQIWAFTLGWMNPDDSLQWWWSDQAAWPKGSCSVFHQVKPIWPPTRQHCQNIMQPPHKSGATLALQKRKKGGNLVWGMIAFFCFSLIKFSSPRAGCFLFHDCVFYFTTATGLSPRTVIPYTIFNVGKNFQDHQVQCQPIPTMPTKSRPSVPYLHICSTPPGSVTPSHYWAACSNPDCTGIGSLTHPIGKDGLKWIRGSRGTSEYYCTHEGGRTGFAHIATGPSANPAPAAPC